MLPKNLWIRLVGCLGAMVFGFIAIKYMHLSGAIITADTSIILFILMLIVYVTVHTITEHFTVTRK